VVLLQGHRRNIPTPVNRRRKRQWLCFTIEGLNSFTTVFVFQLPYFFLQAKFGFTGQGQPRRRRPAWTLLRAFLVAGRPARAALGLFHRAQARFWPHGRRAAGRFAARLRGRPDCAAVVVTLGNVFHLAGAGGAHQRKRNAARVPHAVGIYNITWAATNALAYFIGGTLIVKFGFHSVFYAPIALLMVQFALTVCCNPWPGAFTRGGGNRGRAAARPKPAVPGAGEDLPAHGVAGQSVRLHRHQHAHRRHPPAWPRGLNCSPMMAGFICSLWCFVRLGVFFALWFWTGWHYRFRWLATAFCLVLGFATILVAPNWRCWSGRKSSSARRSG